MQEFKIERANLSDLIFNGELIGKGSGTDPRLKIYRTDGGEFIAAVKFDSERSVANHFHKPEELVAWLRARSGNISEEDQQAIEEAARNNDLFKAFWTERIA
jgi:hypothetical protein